MAEPDHAAQLEPLPYQRALNTYLKREDSELWDWFASDKTQQQQVEAVRLDLLKSTYRLDRDAHAQLYDAADEVQRKLRIETQVTFYQAQSDTGLNASLASLPGQAHIVLHGAVVELLSPAELLAVIGHELTHGHLWTLEQGEHMIAQRMIAALSHEAGEDSSAYVASARLQGLFNEVFCDRGALLACGNLHTTVSALVKMETGLRQVSPENYLRQADEIFHSGGQQTQGLTHPECFIRSRALQLWSDGAEDADTQIEALIRGPLVLSELDLLGRRKVSRLTQRLISAMLAPVWMRTDGALSHARLYFEDFALPEEQPDLKQLAEDLATDDKHLRDYYSYVLLDFVTIDRDLEEAPLAAALRLSAALDLEESFKPLAAKELGLRKQQIEAVGKQAEKIIADAQGDLAPEAESSP